MQLSACEQIFADDAIMNTLQKTTFDVFITDVCDPCARIVTSMLGMPTVGYSSHGLTPDASFFPHIMSMTPVMFAPMADEMSFGERIGNAIGYFMNHWLFVPIAYRASQRVADQNNIKLSVPIESAFINALILVGTDFTFEYPRPLMPNVIPIGGWFVKSFKPLEGEVKTFVENSGSNGIIYLSFGHLVSKSESTKMKMLAEVFSSFPDQRFIWTYNGPAIDVPKNVMQMKWVPQNDLLAHSKMRLFITHCGSHSTYEAIHYGLPILAVPLFSDQPSNAHRLVNRLHMGVLLDFRSMTMNMLVDSIHEVMSNTTYKVNAKRAQALHLDQQTTPFSRMVYYIEYVIRHQGAGMLVSKPLSTLSLLQLCCVDVLTTIFTVFLIVLLLLYLLIRCAVRCMWRYCQKHHIQVKKKKH